MDSFSAIGGPRCGIAQDVTGYHRASCFKRASRACKRGHDHVVEAVSAILDMSGMTYTTKHAHIPRHLDSAKCRGILVQCKAAHCEDLVLDFSLTHP
jgi:hypothetical protein